MDKKFLRENSGWFIQGERGLPTNISHAFRTNLTIAAMRKAYHFFIIFFDISLSTVDLEKHILEYERNHSLAISLGFFQRGGAREKDCLR